MPDKELDKYGFTSAAWKRGLVIGIMSLLTVAVSWLALKLFKRDSDCVSVDTYKVAIKEKQDATRAKDSVTASYNLYLQNIINTASAEKDRAQSNKEELDRVKKQNDLLTDALKKANEIVREYNNAAKKLKP